MIKIVKIFLLCFLGFLTICIDAYADGANRWQVDAVKVYTYQDMVEDMEYISEHYQMEDLHVDSLGTTFDGRKLYHIVIGNKDATKQILVIGAIHGREYITAQLVMKQVEDLLEHYAELSALLDQTAIHFVPMSNPDGVTISQLGLNGMNHRSTRQKIYQAYANDGAVELADYLPQWKANGKGVDLNRNFDALWDEYQKGPQKPSSDCYKGLTPHSEVESKALVKLTKEYPFAATISYHTQGQVIYWYFGQEGECLEKSQKLAELVSDITGYVTYANYETLDPAGYKDWAIQKNNIPSLTIEVGVGKNPVDPDQFESIWKKNKDVIFQIMENVCGLY